MAEGAAEKAEDRLGGNERGKGNDLAGGPDKEGKDGGFGPDGSPSGGSKGGLVGEARDPKRKPVKFHDEEVLVPVGPGEGDATGEFVIGDPNEGEARVGYEKVLVKYRSEMEKAMDEEAYPEEYRRAVRDYFDSLK